MIDLLPSSADLAAFAPEIILLIGAVAALLVPMLLPRQNLLAVPVAAAGALAASAAYAVAVVSGGNAAALGLLAAWAVPDLRAARAGEDYEGDLLGAAAIAAALLAIPFARPEASWLAGVTGGALGLLLGLGLARGELREW